MKRTIPPKKNVPGRPRLWETPAHLQYQIDRYFESCIDRNWVEKIDPKTHEPYVEEKITQVKPYTVSGLAVYLGVLRETLLYYQGIDDVFLSTIMAAKAKCEAFAEEQLYTGKGAHGIIFSIKNNYKHWEDKTRQEISGIDGQPIGIHTNDERAKDARKRLLEEANK